MMLEHWKAKWRSIGRRRQVTAEQPLRAELYSAEQLEQHGETLADSHKDARAHGPDRLLPRLAANEAVLKDACQLLSQAIEAGRRITPAGEWLLDNFYLIEEQILTARRHLPKHYSWELPRLSSGATAGFPRVYDIALQAIAHGDGRVDGEGLTRFVSAYQRVTTLNLGELWAIPIMLRLALIENLRRVGARIAADRRDRNLADVWADKIIDVAQKDAKNLILVVADMAHSAPPMVSAFVAEIARRLQGQNHALALPLTWVEQSLAELGLTIAQLVQAENQHQAANQVSISNCIGSLRLLAVMDWREFVESLSVTEQMLRRDPAGVYPNMDFATRDRYRHVVERLGRRGRLSEAAVAQSALELAERAAGSSGQSDRAAHIGYYLIDDGLPLLERTAGVSVFSRSQVNDHQVRVLLYLGAIFVFTAAGTAVALYRAEAGGAHGATVVGIALLAMLCASQVAVAIVNRIAGLLVAPRLLPRMDFVRGVPAHARTLVVVPTMLGSTAAVEALLENLEVRFIANRDPQLHFGLLTDFVDAPRETMPADEAILALAERGVAELNAKYRGDDGAGGFFLFHRPRRWNPRERVWMGYERKRGKLGDLNALLRGGGAANFARVAGDLRELRDVKYIITLDTDTQLPRDAARLLAATMAHPLNRTVPGAGYGILQPRVAASLTSTQRSRYAQMHGGDAGIDPYTRAVSDVYQDVFGEGSFIGKGIYDIDAFEAALKDRLPENHILSHDLLEGCYARSGLASDIELIEDYPADYQADARRHHRWIRGDWQIAHWLLPRVRDSQGVATKNPLSALSRWKILDNLRRSVVPIALTLLLLFGWLLSPAAGFWTAVVLGVAFIPAAIDSVLDVWRKPAAASFAAHVRVAAGAAARRFASLVFGLACLPYDAALSADAIVRTAVRMLITRRNRLQWTPSSEIERRPEGSFAASVRRMWLAPALACATTVYLCIERPLALIVAAPLLLLWIGAPLFAWWLSRPRAPDTANLDSAERGFLRTTARRTWAFFDTLIGAEDNWLPPDNLQEKPARVVAHRTSPTNIGLALLSTACAHDFGYVSAGSMLLRIGRTLDTLQNLERERGHFYNWYDTRTLQPLPPAYVSTVDSGNLCAHLITLQAAVRGMPDEPIISAKTWCGMGDTLAVLLDASTPPLRDAAARFGTCIENTRRSPPSSLVASVTALRSLFALSASLANDVAEQPTGEAVMWAQALSAQCGDQLEEILRLMPWLEASLPHALRTFLDETPVPTWRALPAFVSALLLALDRDATDAHTASQREQIVHLRRDIAETARSAQARLALVQHRADHVRELAQMDFRFLYDQDRHLFTIGYNVIDRRRDAGYYDLLASEARLAVFVAIALGQVPQDSWFALGRLLTQSGGVPALLSWSGSMFEYLMPLLVMPCYAGTLLDQSCAAAVRRQIDYARGRNLPWGISESGYNAVDAAHNYQYHAFGVPGLGLQRGLAEDAVVTPHASALASMIAPHEAVRNLLALAAQGMLGSFGFYEAADYTTARLRRGESFAIVRSFMAHHQGMSLLAIANVLLDGIMTRRFTAEPMFRATLPLLQERIPRLGVSLSHNAELRDTRAPSEIPEMPVRVFTDPGTALPGVQLLSNGRYHVMITNAGGGYSRWQELALTRWREDTTCDNWGTFCYIRDLESGKVWSNTLQPALTPADSYEATFTEPRVEFNRRDDGIETHTDIAVSPEDDIELRRVRITNRSRRRRTLEVTSYAEVVLAPAIADAMHRTFSNLFVQTEIVQPRTAILCARRPRANSERWPCMLHGLVLHGAESIGTSCETDRARFLGRCNSVVDPRALREPGELSGTQGAVLDPIVAIRHRFVLEAEQSVTLDMVTGIGADRAACLALIEKYHDKHLGDRVFDLAWTHSQVALRQINISEADAQLYGRLAGRVLYANGSLRADANLIAANRRGQSGLWGYSISGDLPIVLLQIRDRESMDLVRQLVQAHAYWRMKGFAVDLVIWNDDRGGYRQVLQEQILGLIAAGAEASVIDRPGGIFVRPAEQIAAEDRTLLLAVSRAILSDARGALSDQVKRRDPIELQIPRFMPTRAVEAFAASVAGERERLLDNGLGGFSADGREYVITTARDSRTPAPWVNVLANPHFGSVVSESGGAYTWAENAHEFRISPWHNDPVGDPSGEAFYVRDEETGHFWSPTPLPAGGDAPYTVRHGFGYSVFEHIEDGIRTEMWTYVALDVPVKFTVIKVRNLGDRPRRLSLTGYVEWVLGDLRSRSALHTVSQIDENGGALLARNAFNPEFSERIAFFDVDDPTRTLSGDRNEFIGRNGTLGKPAAMLRARLSGKVGAALDPCGAIQVPIELGAQQSRDVIFRLGAGEGVDSTSELVLRLRKSGTARAALDAIRDYWKGTLGAVQVKTPLPELDVLANGWLLYQTIACRLWGRSGYYQSGGAYGFRDQLQDAMALVHTQPALLRAQLLRCASRQFREGDVQHWWHPPSGRGVRTRCSDDYLWLPLATCRYVTCSGDRAVLHEHAGFLDGRAVAAGDDSYYDLPLESTENADLYEHCVRAIRHGLVFGAHGLPLMGSGDWNDGLNNVGLQGKGESVWLGFFLCRVLEDFVPIAQMRGDAATAQLCRSERAKLKDNLEQHAWDGAWYRRAYFDDGTPLGSASNSECRIDAIAQSWAVLSDVASDERARAAMNALDEHLVDRSNSLIKLLDPPFDRTTLDPGYIKGYLPGVRENGGQYTHAAIWASMAFAALGDAERACELLAAINPLNHSRSLREAEIYKVEPYVVSADVYAVPPHVGRGGWSWYTGSAGWLYRLITESILGLQREADRLRICPCIPQDWSGFTAVYRHLETFYDIEVSRDVAAKSPLRVMLDGVEQRDGSIILQNDGARHPVTVILPG